MNKRTKKKGAMSKKSKQNNERIKIAVIAINQHKATKNCIISENIQSKTSFWKKLTLFKLRPTTKFQIIIFSYWLQWTPPC